MKHITLVVVLLSGCAAQAEDPVEDFLGDARKCRPGTVGIDMRGATGVTLDGVVITGAEAPVVVNEDDPPPKGRGNVFEKCL